jgi:hypothetical protein
MQFDEFYQSLEAELRQLARTSFVKYRVAAQKDITQYLRLSRSRLQDYARLVESGQLKEIEKDFLICSLKQNAVLFALKETGRSKQALLKFAGAIATITVEMLISRLI